MYLLGQARGRNQAEMITGLLVYDRGLFYQWIEGS
ncbi:MAG: blue light sensor protein, partial [Betaproteobacteria bacterium]|nr:blue light sensor protein [Betaproteobacteria bacterium]